MTRPTSRTGPRTAADPPCSTRQLQLGTGLEPGRVCRFLRRRHPVTLWFDGAGGFADRWSVGSLLAVEPVVELSVRNGPGTDLVDPLERLARLVEARRGQGGVAETGIVAVLAYDLLRDDRPERDDDGLPEMVVLRVDRSIRFFGNGEARLTVRDRGRDAGTEAWIDRLAEQLRAGAGPAPAVPARCTGRPASSLPRETYLRAVQRIRRHIACGDIYQANLCQRLSTRYAGDELELYLDLARRCPAPRSAFVATDGLALASVSPETFLRVRPPDRIETLPIKGTRPRGETPLADEQAARELLASPKDRAELLMIVDLERNDLGRVCRAGSVRTTELAGLRSYAAVHHLVGRVEGRLREGTGLDGLLRATFPGGSITGAPKLRAMQILENLEPVRRSYFTGSLFWFGDDGAVDSSILIRTLVFAGGRALLGAGGGIVADSDPAQEWHESNHKARALAAALGFDPEEAS